MTPQKESPWTVCRPAKGKKQREIKSNIIALLPAGQAFSLALQPWLELVPAALFIAIMGAIR